VTATGDACQTSHIRDYVVVASFLSHTVIRVEWAKRNRVHHILTIWLSPDNICLSQLLTLHLPADDSARPMKWAFVR
jgi:hypothetical protein